MADTTLRLLNRFSHGMISSGINMPESLRLNSNLPSRKWISGLGWIWRVLPGCLEISVLE